jgi:hypothetical protein
MVGMAAQGLVLLSQAQEFFMLVEAAAQLVLLTQFQLA